MTMRKVTVTKETPHLGSEGGGVTLQTCPHLGKEGDSFQASTTTSLEQETPFLHARVLQGLWHLLRPSGGCEIPRNVPKASHPRHTVAKKGPLKACCHPWGHLQSWKHRL